MNVTISSPPSTGSSHAQHPNYRALYRIGGFAAAIMVLLTLLHIGVFFLVGLPDSVLAWFELFQRNPVGGLLAFEMLSLANAHGLATTAAERAAYLAAGEATMATFKGTAFWSSYLLGSIGGILLSIVMLRTSVFSKTTAYLRLVSGVLDFGIFVPTVGLFIALISVFCLMGFNVLVARRLLQIARAG
ncbi:MAG: hypothetical protein JSU96_13765 [Acidobacteriota bacterium]|nr:MAG: hypothetical protein JSU96_13765 [Acidobacteriota bacterium]